MSGCANCVWIVYAQDLERMFLDGGTTAKKLILERMQDPSMRAFLSMEIALQARDAAKPAATSSGSSGPMGDSGTEPK